MNRTLFKVVGLLLALSLVVPFQNAMAKKPPAPGALTLPLAGTVVGAGTFSGTVTINRFARTGDGGIVAVGVARGTVTDAVGQVMQTGLQTVVLPVNRGVRTAGFATPPAAEPRLMPASFTKATSGRLVLAQAASCQILNLDIGGNAINLLGFVVNLSPITLDISDDSAGPLGALVCEIVALLGTAADVVGLLNDLLGLLTGLVGGVVGGIGGIGG
ncbi:MAG TPA: hypothetical protein VFS80_12565 [Burkholderiales bacterium]|nr:hypothetical protein [Burkholderiales bacterium]